MNATTFYTTLLREHYDVDAVALQPLSETSIEEGHMVYRVQHLDGRCWIARSYRRDRPMLDWFRYFFPRSTGDIADWLLTRAATLVYLEQQAYPAPQVIRTRTGSLLSEIQEWTTLITTFVEGAIIQPTLAQLHLLGAALGHLHTLNPDNAVIPSLLSGQALSAAKNLGKSYWHTEYAIPTALAHLDSIEHMIPPEWISIHEGYYQTFLHIQQRPDLPSAIIHGDVWAANAVQTTADQVVLIDWDSSGSGLAMLDLGRLLLECHLDSNLPVDDALAWHIQPDAQRIAAVVDGYCQRRMLTPSEFGSLLDAVRFGVAFIGTLHLTQALQVGSHDQNWVRGMDQRFARLQNRWAVSQEIASLARERFEQVQASESEKGNNHQNKGKEGQP